MKSGIQFKQGEIIIVPFPFSDFRGTKQRPVLVLSKSEYNDYCEDLITCGITSNKKDSKHAIIIENKDVNPHLRCLYFSLFYFYIFYIFCIVKLVLL
jgi:mRNA-degrading endonuclease toxin of MazEF toxin-antitoxin module